MDKLHIITPVKDSIDLTIQTIQAITESVITVPFTYTVYNDFSTPENTLRLEEAAKAYGFTLVNLSDITEHPSPNYLLVLQIARQNAIREDAALCIVESDVLVKPDTLQTLFDETLRRTDCAMSAAVTVDKNGEANYPYLYAKEEKDKVLNTDQCLSFCCTLLSLSFLKAYDFNRLDPAKIWYDAILTKVSLKLGYKNYLFTNLPVFHQPHGSRPWRTFREQNIFMYYLYKWTGRRDKMIVKPKT